MTPMLSGTQAAPPAVLVHDLFRLHSGPAGDVAALRGLSLEVAAGERVVVYGPNGSGKTTLLQVLAGEQPPSSGSVAVAGVDLVGADEQTRTQLRARLLGVIDQHHGRTLRPELDVCDNVALQLRILGWRRREARASADGLLVQLGVGALSRRSPTTLSDGEAQRVAVCAALAHRPSLVLADEPTGDLDADNAEAVYDLLVAATAATGAALLLVTHDARGARVGDRVVRIRDGRVTETWSPSRPELETLVVDDRGWLRLPDAVRAASGVGSGVLVEVNDGRVLLRAAQPRTPHDGDGLPAASAVTAPRNEAVAALEGVSRSRQGRPLFGPLDLRVRPGSLMVLRGPSGSGKSTLLRTLVGLERPDAGRVEILGQPLADLDRDALALLRRRHVAVAGQATSLAESLDVVSNVELARALRQQPAAPARVGAAIDAVGLTALARRSVEVLSGGERQRVAIARVLAVDAVLAVFDEPTSKLDERGAALVAALLRSLADGGRAVVCATHDLRLADVADVIIEIGAQGRIDSERPDLASHAPHL